MNNKNDKLQSGSGESPIENTSNQDEISVEEKAFISEYLALGRHNTLMKKDAITVRMFSMQDKTTIVTLVFGELDDSFIIGLPAIIGHSDGVIEARLISSSAMNRMFKNSFSLMAIPLPKFLYHYLLMLKKHTKDLPGYFDSGRASQINVLLEVLKSMPDVVPLKATKVKQKLEKHEGYAILEKLEAQLENLSSQVSGELEEDQLFATARPTTRYRH